MVHQTIEHVNARPWRDRASELATVTSIDFEVTP